MTKGLAKLNRVRLVFGKSGPLLKTVVAAAVVLSAMVLITLSLTCRQTRAAAQTLEQRAAVLQQENAELQGRIDALGTAESIRRIATEELGLVDPNTIIIVSE